MMCHSLTQVCVWGGHVPLNDPGVCVCVCWGERHVPLNDTGVCVCVGGGEACTT
jgi:hypothetical protein